MYEEWFIGPTNGHIAEVPGWQRPFQAATAMGYQRACPTNAWLMAPPVLYQNEHVFVADGAVWSLPMYRLAGLRAPANGEFSTAPVMLGGTGGLWINMDAHWGAPLPTGGCDEGCQAYVMVEVLDAITKQVVPGYEKEKCVITNADDTMFPLRWNGTAATGMAVRRSVQFRVYFRDAVVYAIGGF